MLTQSWLLVAVVYIYFAWVFWRFSNTPVREFTFRDRGEAGKVDKDNPEVEAFKNEFLDDLKGYLDAINRQNKIRFRLSAGGFFIAALAALVTMLLTSS